MDTRERHRRDIEILAMNEAGMPAREIAEKLGISKRQVNRVIAARQRDRAQMIGRSLDPAANPSSAVALLEEMEELYLRASRQAKTGARFNVMLSLTLDQTAWKDRRALLEQLIAGMGAETTGS
jgi:predicted transcriptional regulator